MYYVSLLPAEKGEYRGGCDNITWNLTWERRACGKSSSMLWDRWRTKLKWLPLQLVAVVAIAIAVVVVVVVVVVVHTKYQWQSNWGVELAWMQSNWGARACNLLTQPVNKGQMLPLYHQDVVTLCAMCRLNALARALPLPDSCSCAQQYLMWV